MGAAPDLKNGCNALLGLIQLVCARDDISSEIREALETSHRVSEACAALAKAIRGDWTAPDSHIANCEACQEIETRTERDELSVALFNMSTRAAKGDAEVHRLKLEIGRLTNSIETFALACDAKRHAARSASLDAPFAWAAQYGAEERVWSLAAQMMRAALTARAAASPPIGLSNDDARGAGSQPVKEDRAAPSSSNPNPKIEEGRS